MPSTYSPSLRFTLMSFGGEEDHWGDVVNTNFGDLLEQAIAGSVAIDLTGGDYSLTVNDGAVDESRNAALRFVGSPSSVPTVTLPSVAKSYIVENTLDTSVVLTAFNNTQSISPKSMSRVVVYSGGIRAFLITDAVDAVLRSQSEEGLRDYTGVASLKDEEFVGTPRAPQPPANDSSTQIATTAFVKKYAIPSGTVIMWSGSYANIPDGWDLCDGSNGTTDLRGLMILGAGATYSVGQTGGSRHSVLVSHDHGGRTGIQSVSHTHSGNTNNTGAHVHGGVMAGNSWHTDNRSRPIMIGTYGSTASAGAHTHTLSTGNASANHTHNITASGVTGTDKNMPPYYTLAYLRKR